jgi:predicted phosphodiesterase
MSFCHATPRSDSEIFTRLTPENHLLPAFAGTNVPVVVCGHTHMQFDRTIGNIRVLNAGSVGMPVGKPGAYWLLLGPEVQLRHTLYDLSKVAERIQATKYPQAQNFAAGSVLEPPSEDETLKAFTRVQLR